MHMQQNTGSGALPRNKGLTLSRGEYFLVLDNDEAITPTALEELYTLAKKFDADVVACEKYYNIPEQFWYNAQYRKQLKPYTYLKYKLVTEPTFLTNNLLERLKRCQLGGFLWPLWSKLVRRDFVLRNELSFANTIVDDFIFTLCLICITKKILLVPNVINYYRVVTDSISHKQREPLHHFQKYFKSLTPGFRYIDEFLSKRKIFLQHPNFKYALFYKIIEEICGCLRSVYGKISPVAFDEILRKELVSGDNIALAAFAFNMMNVKHLQLTQTIQKFNLFAQQSQRRIAELEAEVKRLKS